MPQQRTRRWSVTYFTSTDPRGLKGLLEQLEALVPSLLNFIIVGQEICPDTGRPHLQGYYETSKRMTFNALKSALPDNPHIEPAKKSGWRNIKYCEKEGNVGLRKGKPMHQGKRSDLMQVKEDIDNMATEMDLWDGHFGQMVRYNKSFQQYRMLKMQTLHREAPEVKVIWGETGLGKTYYVKRCEPPANLWNWGGDRWFDGYIGQEAALFDDFDGSQIHFRMLLRVLDRYTMNVPVKGGFVPWVPKRIYITSNLDPETWFPQEDYAPLRRRITSLVHKEVGQDGIEQPREIEEIE